MATTEFIICITCGTYLGIAIGWFITSMIDLIKIERELRKYKKDQENKKHEK